MKEQQWEYLNGIVENPAKVGLKENDMVVLELSKDEKGKASWDVYFKQANDPTNG